jgi:hypothetical protein
MIDGSCSLLIALIELKSKNYHADDVKEKMENCRQMTEYVLKDMGIELKICNLNLFLVCQTNRPSEYKSLQRTYINFYGKKKFITTIRSGERISKYLSV